MDLLHFPSLLLSLSFLFLSTLIMRLYLAKPRGLTLPPGPMKLPIIGNLHYVLTSLPHQAFARLAKKHGGVMLVRLGQVDVVIISSREACEEVFRSQDTKFSSRPATPIRSYLTYGLKDLVFAPYGDYWRQIKKLAIVELLGAQRVKLLHSHFEDVVSELITGISFSREEPINLSEMLVTLMNRLTARCAFGSASQEQEKFIPLVTEIFDMASGFILDDLFPNVKYLDVLTGTRSKIERIHRQSDRILGKIIKDHELKRAKTSTNRVNEVEDLIDVLLRIRASGELEIPLTDDHIKAVILDLFSAGTQSSSTLIAWAMSGLMQDPPLMKKAQEEVRRVGKGKKKIEHSDLGELHYMKLVIIETLRIHPPVPLIPRRCIESCQVDGYDIRAGTSVLINLWGLGRDPRNWDDAEKFKPERFCDSDMDVKGTNLDLMPYGGGRRICPGITFANTATELTLANLLFQFNWELPNGMRPEELDMSETSGLSASRKIDLCLLATPYSPLVV